MAFADRTDPEDNKNVTYTTTFYRFELKIHLFIFYLTAILWRKTFDETSGLAFKYQPVPPVLNAFYGIV